MRTRHDHGRRRRLRVGAFAGALLTVIVAGAGTPAGADCRDPFRDPDDVLDFHLQTTTATWAAFQSSTISGGGCDDQYPYFSAQFRCGEDEAPISIGFRRKRDRSETRAKLPIKLDFNREIPGQRWPAARGGLGFRKLSLNSGMADDAGRTGGPGSPANPGTLSALLTEHLAWRLMRQELPEVSGVAYARLTVEFSDTGTTQYQGLYVLIEDIDRTAVKARFGADDDAGTLLKTTDIACVDQVEYDDGPPNAATDLFTAWLAETPESFPGGWYARTDQAVHLDSLLRQEALRELLANTGDTVLGNRNNYFSLDLRSDRRWYFPWDLDDMFRPFPQVRAPDTALVHACAGGAGCSPNRIGQNIRDNPEIRPRYLEILCQLSNGVADETRLVERLLALDALVRPLLAAEVASIWAPLGRDPLNAAVAGTYAAEVERMKTWIPARVEAVRAMIRAEGVACDRGCLEGAVQD
ncbi:MAG TPA: CotH kinase family protein, partial [Polyangia bacterium]